MTTFTVCGPRPLSAATRRALEKLAVGATREMVKRGATSIPVAKVAEQITYEADIENTFDRAMELDGWRPIKQEENFSERKRKKTGEPGMADKLYIRYRPRNEHYPLHPCTNVEFFNGAAAEVLWIEWKRIIVRVGRKNKASQAEPGQLKWIERERSRGALVWLAGVDFAASIAGAAQYHLDSGLCGRREPFLAMIPPEGRPKE